MPQNTAGQGVLQPFAAGVPKLTIEPEGIAQMGSQLGAAYERGYKLAEYMGQQGARNRLVAADVKQAEQQEKIRQLQIEAATFQMDQAREDEAVLGAAARKAKRQQLEDITNPTGKALRDLEVQEFLITGRQPGTPITEQITTLPTEAELRARTEEERQRQLQVNAAQQAALAPLPAEVIPPIAPAPVQPAPLAPEILEAQQGPAVPTVAEQEAARLKQTQPGPVAAPGERLAQLGVEREAIRTRPAEALLTPEMVTPKTTTRTYQPGTPQYVSAIAQRVYDWQLRAAQANAAIEATKKGTGNLDIKDKLQIVQELKQPLARVDSPYQAYEKVISSASAIEALAKKQSPMSDLAILYSFIRLLDPNSVVREGEIHLAQSAMPYLQRFQKFWQGFTPAGAVFTPQMRAEVLAASREVADERAKAALPYVEQLKEWSSVEGALPGRSIAEQVLPRQVFETFDYYQKHGTLPRGEAARMISGLPDATGQTPQAVAAQGVKDAQNFPLPVKGQAVTLPKVYDPQGNLLFQGGASAAPVAPPQAAGKGVSAITPQKAGEGALGSIGGFFKGMVSGGKKTGSAAIQEVIPSRK